MKSAYIAIAVVAMIAAVVLLSGCTSGPGLNATAKPTIAPTVVANTSMPVAGTSDMASGANITGMATQWPDIISGNNTSVINTSEGMREVPNSMLAGNKTVKKDTEVDTSAATTDAATTDAATTDAAISNASGTNKSAKASPTVIP
jgi:hypothetical protein